MKNNFCGNGQLHCQFNIFELESKSESESVEVYSSTCVVAKHSLLLEWKVKQQPENQGHVEI